MRTTFHPDPVDLEDPVAPEDAGSLGGAARQNGGYVLERRVQLAIDRLEVAALAHLATYVETKA